MPDAETPDAENPAAIVPRRAVNSSPDEQTRFASLLHSTGGGFSLYNLTRRR